jgi:magnesium transporter
MQGRILEGDRVRVSSDPTEIRAALEAGKSIWIELEKRDAACDAMLVEDLDLHPLTVEDIWATRSAPKLEEYDTYLYVIVHAVRGMRGGALDLVELDIVMGSTFVITHDPTQVTEEVRAELERSPRLLAKGPAWLAHAVLDHAIDAYMPIIDSLDNEIADLENEVLAKAGTPHGPPILRKILQFKRMLLDLRRASIRQREILLRLARGEFDEIPRELVPFYRDVYDHFLRITDLVESYRDLVTSALDAYLSVQSNRMNDIMKTLTLISTLMLPITFIAGVYGMNFKYMPELDAVWGYPAALGTMGAVVVLCLFWFWRKGWIGHRDIPDALDPRDGGGA